MGVQGCNPSEGFGGLSPFGTHGTDNDIDFDAVGPKRGEQNGRRGIRTPGPVTQSPVFKTGAINHSAILPDIRVGYKFGRRVIQGAAGRQGFGV